MNYHTCYENTFNKIWLAAGAGLSGSNIDADVSIVNIMPGVDTCGC